MSSESDYSNYHHGKHKGECKDRRKHKVCYKKGPTGPSGPTGAAGPKGSKGPVGPAGPTGLTGELGPVGPRGDIGCRGIPGCKGEQGCQGPRGCRGKKGYDGPSGSDGPTGPVGPTGPTGSSIVGPTGPTGSGGIGPVGPPGPQGPPSNTGFAFSDFTLVDTAPAVAGTLWEIFLPPGAAVYVIYQIAAARNDGVNIDESVVYHDAFAFRYEGGLFGMNQYSLKPTTLPPAVAVPPEPNFRNLTLNGGTGFTNPPFLNTPGVPGQLRLLAFDANVAVRWMTRVNVVTVTI